MKSRGFLEYELANKKKCFALKNNFNENLINIGFTFYEGEYRVFEKNFNAISSQKADSESLEYYLNYLI